MNEMKKKTKRKKEHQNPTTKTIAGKRKRGNHVANWFVAEASSRIFGSFPSTIIETQL